jgi:ubiquinone/menaquinone biosynthesis C-methylase UbiE
MEAYYERRSNEYDDWYTGEGLFAERERPGWRDELSAVEDAVAALPPARTLDLACGTGYVTRHLRGHVIGLDLSESMLHKARGRLEGPLVRADARSLPFGPHSFERVFAGHFYGHLPVGDRDRFLTEVRRIAPELVVLDAALRDGVAPEELQERVLSDGSTHVVYKRYFTAGQLLAESGGGDVLFQGRWFVLVSSPSSTGDRGDQ